MSLAEYPTFDELMKMKAENTAGNYWQGLSFFPVISD